MYDSMTPAKEKRKFSRVPFITRIDVIMDPHGEKMELSVDSKNLSLRGIFAQTEKKFQNGTDCSVIIHLTGSVEDIRLNIQGKVARQDKTGVGIIFETMDVDAYTHLKNIVKYNR